MLNPVETPTDPLRRALHDEMRESIARAERLEQLGEGRAYLPAPEFRTEGLAADAAADDLMRWLSETAAEERATAAAIQTAYGALRACLRLKHAPEEAPPLWQDAILPAFYRADMQLPAELADGDEAGRLLGFIFAAADND